jgi:hypothetical protein
MGSIFGALNLIHLVEKYEGLITKLVGLFAQFKGTEPGGTVTIPDITFDAEGERWTIPAHPATRIS